MEIRVLEIIPHLDATWVSFSTAYGSANAVWAGSTCPYIDRQYDVEFEIDSVLTWGIEAVLSNSLGNRIEVMENLNIKITGQLESLDDDGYAVLRLGNYIVPFLLKNGEPDIVDNYISISVAHIIIYPV